MKYSIAHMPCYWKSVACMMLSEIPPQVRLLSSKLGLIFPYLESSLKNQYVRENNTCISLSCCFQGLFFKVLIFVVCSADWVRLKMIQKVLQVSASNVYWNYWRDLKHKNFLVLMVSLSLDKDPFFGNYVDPAPILLPHRLTEWQWWALNFPVAKHVLKNVLVLLSQWFYERVK